MNSEGLPFNIVFFCFLIFNMKYLVRICALLPGKSVGKVYRTVQHGSFCKGYGQLAPLGSF